MGYSAQIGRLKSIFSSPINWVYDLRMAAHVLLPGSFSGYVREWRFVDRGRNGGSCIPECELTATPVAVVGVPAGPACGLVVFSRCTVCAVSAVEALRSVTSIETAVQVSDFRPWLADQQRMIRVDARADGASSVCVTRYWLENVSIYGCS